MRRFLGFLLRLFYAAAWLLVFCAAGLIALEESGFLTRIVRERLARELGALGPHVHLERARLLWFEPGLVLDGLTFDGERDDEGVWIPGHERLRLSSIHVRLDPLLDPRRPVREVEVKGGRLLLAQPLLDAVRDLLEQGGEDAGGPALPPITIHGIALEVERAPQTSDARPERIPLGSADLDLRTAVAAPSVPGGVRRRDTLVRGRIHPSLGGAVQAPNTIVLDGVAAADGGLSLRVSARGLVLDSAGLASGDAERVFGLERFRGELDLDLETHLTPGSAPEATLALRLEDARLERRGELPLSDLSASADARFAPQPGMTFASPAAWTATLSAAGRYAESAIGATALLGGNAPPDRFIEAWGRLEGLPLDEASLAAFHVDDLFEVMETYRALEPEGKVDVAFSARLPRASLAQGAPLRPEIAVAVDVDGGAAMAYRGWQDERGVRRGVPLRCTDVRGRMLVAFRADLAQPARFAMVDLSGQHGTGPAYASGLITSPREGLHSNLDLVLRVPTIAIDDRLGAALGSLEGISQTWTDLSPAGGTLDSEWRLRRRKELDGLTAVGHVGVSDASLTWRDVPVPLTGLEGSIDMRWSERASFVTDEPLTLYGEPPIHRPIAVLWSVGAKPGTAQPTGLVVRARGLLRESPLPPEVARAEIPPVAASSLEVELEDLLLRGRDWDVLAARFPEVGTQVTDLRGQGRIDAAFRGRRPTADASYRYDVEVVARPGEVVVTPTVFRRQTQDVVGRILLRGREAEPGARDESDGRFHLFGSWGRDVVLAGTGTFAAAGGDVIVWGAGVDPASPTLRGALASSLAEEGGRAVDLSAIEIDGRLDFEARVELTAALAAPAPPANALAEPASKYRIFLRDNRLRSELFGLDALAGVVLQEKGALSSPLLRASLGGTPVELTGVLLLPLAAAAQHPRADALLAQAGFTESADGFAFQADWAATDVALDREHLKTFVDDETLQLLLERNGLGGAVDVSGARVVAVSPRDGGGKIAFRGNVTPRSVRLSAGIPLKLMGGAIDIQDLVLEAGRLRGWWRIEHLDAEVAGRTLSDAAMTMTFVDGRLTIDNLRGEFAGGTITSLGGGEQSDRAIAVDLTPPYVYSLGMRLEDVAVEQVMGAIFTSGSDDLGELTSTLRLRGRGTDVLALAGSGSIRLADARLWSIPVVRELFRSLGMDSTAVFDRMELDWTLENGTLALHDIRVRSPILRLVGDGAVELTGEVSSDLQVRYGLVDRIGPLNRIVYWLNNSLFRVAVRGDMGRPVVLVRNSLLELFLGFDGDVPRSLPLPAWPSLTRLF